VDAFQNSKRNTKAWASNSGELQFFKTPRINLRGVFLFFEENYALASDGRILYPDKDIA